MRQPSRTPRSPSSGASSDYPANREGAGLTVEFTFFSAKFLALIGGPHFACTETVSLRVHAAEPAETDRYWTAILENGGSEGRCVWRKDRWELSWPIVPRQLTQILTDPTRLRRSAGSKGGPEIAADSVDHLIWYLKLLFEPQKNESHK